MRSVISAALSSAFILLLLTANLIAAEGRTISGRLVFDNGYACDRQCTVTLLLAGMRPVQTVTPDLAGHFVFNGVPLGSYSIRVDIDGFESVTQSVRDVDGMEPMIMISLVRKPTAQSSGGQVVDVSQYLERYPKKAVSFFEKGSESLKKNKPDESVKYFRNAVELAPSFYEAHNQLGVAYKEAGLRADAEREFQKAHELNSSNVEPLVNLSSLYLDENDLDHAITTGEQALRIDSRSVSALVMLGLALYRTEQFHRAEDVYQRALNLAPAVGAIRLMLADIYFKEAQYDRSLDQLNTYIAENPQGRQIESARDMRDRLIAARAANGP
jgi:tetratricopeptide (TPR) repeat protein